MTLLQSVLEKNLNRTMQDIRNGLPEVSEEEGDDGTDFEFAGTTAGKWTCSTCQIKIDMNTENCPSCRRPRPSYKLRQD